MATGTPKKSSSPYAGNTKDTTTSGTGRANATITIELVGTVSQIQADYATVIAATMTCPTALINHS